MEIFYLCIKIFLARILDVSLGTIRVVFVVKEKKIFAALIAFIEVLIWFEIVRESLAGNISSPFIAISFAGGYACGTYLGSIISSKYIKGHLTLNVISDKITDKDIDFLKSQNYGLSVISMENKKKMLVIEINKNNLKELKDLLFAIDKKAFIIINETKIVQNGFIK